MKIKEFITIFIFVFLAMSSASAYPEDQLNNDDHARFGLAVSLNNLGRHTESLPLLVGLSRRYPGDKQISMELASTYGYLMMLGDSGRLFTELRTRYPDDQELLLRFASVLEANKKFEQARDIYRLIYSNSAENAVIARSLADLEIKTGDFRSARLILEGLVRKSAQDAASSLMLADVYFYQKAYKKAIAGYEKCGVTVRSDPGRFKKLADSYRYLTNMNKAVEAYRKLYESDPLNSGYMLILVDCLYQAGKEKEAGQLLERYINMHAGEEQYISELARNVSLYRSYRIILPYLNNFIASNPNNDKVKVFLARLLSWEGSYDKSLAIYDELIAAYPRRILLRREKARVLGWMRRYEQSIKEYRRIQNEIGPDIPSRAEEEAKDAFYHRFDGRALKLYDAWLKLEPDNPEALFDKGQIASRNHRWNEAEEMYNALSNSHADHFRSEQALEKVKVLSRKPAWQFDVEAFRADSSSRKTNVKFIAPGIGVNVPIRQDLDFFVNGRKYFYHFSNDSGKQRARVMTGLRFIKLPLFSLTCAYDYNSFTGRLKERNDFLGEMMLHLSDSWKVFVSHRRQEVIDNDQTLRQGLRNDESRMRWEFEPNQRFLFGSEYAYSAYNDRNIKRLYAVDGALRISYEPRSLRLLYRFESYGFSASRETYFTPHSFHHNDVGIEWRHFLNKEELFWGANDFYYTLRYTARFDLNDQRAHVLYCDLHRDWNKDFSTHLEYSQTFYEHPSIYKEAGAQIYCTWNF